MNKQHLTRALYGVVIGLIAGIIGVALFILFDRLTVPASQNASPFSVVDGEHVDGAIEIAPPRDMPDFTLVNQYGSQISLHDLRGRYVLLTFGYTHCPDICPMTLNAFRRIRTALGEQAAEIAFLFVSVDGERDSPDVLHRYFATRQLEGMIGLTGGEDDIRRLGADYGLSFARRGAENDYLVNHTTGSFLLDAAGRWIRRYQFGIMPGSIADDLKALLAS